MDNNGRSVQTLCLGLPYTMNSETFSQNFLVALGHAKFDLDVSAIKMLDSTLWLPRVPGVQMTNIEGAKKADQLKGEFSLMEGYTPLLAFKFLLGQPLVALVSPW